MPDKIHRSRWFTDRIVLSALGFILTMALVSVALMAHQREQALTQGQRLTSTFAAVVDEQTSRNLQTIDQRIAITTQLLAEIRSDGDTDTSGASRLLHAQVDTLPFIQNVMVLDARGQVAYASSADLRGADMSARDFAMVYKTRPGTGFYVGAPMLGRDGQWLLPTARPLTQERHGFAGVMVMTVKVSYFDQLWATLALDPGSTIGLLRSDGLMLMRSPIDGTAMGRSFADSPLFLQHLPASASGSYRVISRVDGLDRFIAYRTLGQRAELVVVVGRTLDAMLAPWYQLLQLVVGMWLIGSLALLVLAVRLSRQSARRQRAESTSQALAQRLNTACDAAGLVLWDWDLRADQWHVTPTFYTTLGYPALSALVTRSQWQELVHPDDRKFSELDCAYRQSPANQRFDHGLRMRHADGSYRWVRITGQVKERDGQGQPIRMVGIRTDVTERVNAEHERLQMFERISDALVGISADWTITHANARAGKLLGRTVDELVGQNVWTMFPASDGHQFRPVYERCMATQQSEIFEEHFEPAGVWYESHIYPAPDGLSIYFRDITDRKRDEAALRRAKEQAENLINGANAMVVGLDVRGHVTIFNKVAQQLTGYTLADLAGRNWFEVLVPRERYPDVHAEFERLSRGGVPLEFENPILTRSHEERLIAWRNTVLRDGDAVTGVLSFGVDVTARKAAEMALAGSKEQFETLAHHSLQGIALVRTAHVTYVNPAFCAIVGRSAAELSRLSVTQLQQWVHPDDRAGSRERHQRGLAGQPVAETNEIRILDGQGHWRWIQLATRSILLSGLPTLIAMVLDIHDRRLAEVALRASEERFRSAFDWSGIGMGLTALDGRWLQVNPSMCRIVGYSAEELCRMTFMEITHPDDLDVDLGHMAQLHAGRIRHFTMEKRYLHRDGHPVWVSLTVAMVRDASGQPQHTVAQIEDIDRRKQLEQALRESQANLNATIEALPDLMFDVDLEGRIFDAHSPDAGLLLRPVAELIGARVPELMPPETAAIVMDALRDADVHGHSMGQQYALELADGTHWFELAITRKDATSDALPRFIVLCRQITDRIRTLHALRDSETLMRQMAESVSQMFFLMDLNTQRFLYVSPAVQAVFGCQASDLYADPAAWRQIIHDHDRERVARIARQALPVGRYDLQFRVVTSPDTVRWVHARSFPVLDAQGQPYRSAGVVEDITSRKTLEIREEQEHEILQYLASGRPIPEILEKFVLGYEAMFPGMRGSILLLDMDGRHLRHGAAPHLPQAYCEAVDGEAIGPVAGSCGTAAFTGTTVMVNDIATDPRWVEYRELALAHGLRACWSVPIKSVEHQVLGTFAFYFDHPRKASDTEIQAIEHGAQIASQALQRHFAVQALQRSEERYRTLVEWSPMGILIHQAGRVVFCNPAALAMHRATTAQDMIGKPSIELVHLQDRATVERLSGQVLQHNQSTAETEIRALQLDGNTIDLQIKMAPTLFDGAPAIQVVLFDITDRKRAQAQLLNSQQQLRVLSARVLAAQETERRRVAHELHDELGQSLTAIKINLQSQTRSTGQESGALVDENIHIVEQALQHVRSLALALRPSMLDDLGLVSALRWLIDQAHQRQAMEITLQVGDTFRRLAPDLETAAFRIVQEALTNIERHADASKVEISARISPEAVLEVQVRDNGNGFDVTAMRERATAGASMGVLGMAERASLVGGELTVNASPGNGCCVTLRCPVSELASH